MKTALLFGSSGLVGGHLLNQLIKDINYSKIKLFVRSVPEISDPKVEIIKTDFSNLQNHKEDIKGDDCFVCIGTTKKNTPDKFNDLDNYVEVKDYKLSKKTDYWDETLYCLITDNHQIPIGEYTFWDWED